MGFQYGNSISQGKTGIQAGYNDYNASGYDKNNDGVRELQKLPAGKAFQGEVTDIVGKKVSIRLDNGQTLQASMQEKMNFNIGDKVVFQVKSNEASLIEIKPLMNAAMEQNPAILRALEAANIPMNDKTAVMIQKLLQEQMPIDKKSLQEMYKQVLSNANADISTIVQMNKLQLPITEAMVGQFESYKNYEHRIAMEIDHLSVQLPELLEELTMESRTQANQLNGQILQMFVSDKEQTFSLKEERMFGLNEEQVLEGRMLIPEEEQATSSEKKQVFEFKEGIVSVSKEGQVLNQNSNTEEAKTDIRNESMNEKILNSGVRGEQTTPDGLFANSDGNSSEINVSSILTAQERESLLSQLKNISLPDELKEQVLRGDISANQLLKQLQMQNLQNGVDLQSLYQGNEYKKLLKTQITNQWLLRPENLLQEEKIQEFYEKIRFETSQLQKLIDQAGKPDSAAAKTAGGLKDNIDFMNQINQMFTYIQLPLLLSEQPAHSDLYVFTNKKRLQDKEGSLSALLHLDMDVLGSMDIYIELNGIDVSVKFQLADEGTKHLFEENLNFLTDRIEKKGYRMTTEFVQIEKQMNFVEDFLERERGTASMQRFSFDVRA